MESNPPVAPRERCGAKTRQGGTCQKPAGWGTPSSTGRCKLHGGASPNGRKHAQKLEAVQAVATYGLPREVDPHTALLEELHRTAGHVAWLGQKIAEFDTDASLKQYAGSDDGLLWEKPAVWVELYHRERKHFTEVAKTCIAVGIEERRVLLAEQQGAMLAQVIRGVLADLGVADMPEVPSIVRRHLMLLPAAS